MKLFYSSNWKRNQFKNYFTYFQTEANCSTYFCVRSLTLKESIIQSEKFEGRNQWVSTTFRKVIFHSYSTQNTFTSASQSECFWLVRFNETGNLKNSKSCLSNWSTHPFWYCSTTQIFKHVLANVFNHRNLANFSQVLQTWYCLLTLCQISRQWGSPSQVLSLQL